MRIFCLALSHIFDVLWYFYIFTVLPAWEEEQEEQEGTTFIDSEDIHFVIVWHLVTVSVLDGIFYLVTELELHQMMSIRMASNLHEFILSHFTATLIQVAGEGKELATAGRESFIELSLSSKIASLLPFFFKHLSCQLTDPHHQHIHCSIITCTQPWVFIVKYTPTTRGPHQLRITINGTEITRSPFTVHVLPSLEMQHSISGLNRPYGVAVSKSGEVVVSEHTGHRISVYSIEGKKIRSFGSEGSSTEQFKYPRGVAITSDNHILIADGNNHQIQMFTMEGSFVKSFGQKGQKPFQFQYPSGIAVHPSGRVFVAEKNNHRIQVFNPDLTYSHMFGSKGSALGQFMHPRGVAINSSGVVYVTDNNNRVQLFSEDGQFMSSFGSEGSQYGQFYNPLGIFIDFNTVYVTDENHCVSVYTSSGQFIKSFGTLGSGEGELHYPKGVAMNNNTGALYVCDFLKDRVVVYS